MRPIMWVTGAVLLAGCGGVIAERGRAGGRAVTDEPDGRLAREIARSADGSRAGRVVEMQGGQLVIEQYYGDERGRVRMGYSDATPAFRDGRQVRLRDVEVGGSVQVHFRQETMAGVPRVVAIEVVTDEEARELGRRLATGLHHRL